MMMDGLWACARDQRGDGPLPPSIWVGAESSDDIHSRVVTGGSDFLWCDCIPCT